MSFEIGRGVAEVQILKNKQKQNKTKQKKKKKKVKLALSLELFEYFDKIMHKHCY